MDEEVNPNLMTGIVIAGVGMLLFIAFSATWWMPVLGAVAALGYTGYWLVKTGRMPKPSLPTMPSLSRLRRGRSKHLG